MQTFFRILLISSGAMSTVAISLIILSSFLKRYKSKCKYYAWLVVLLGFVLPFRINFNLALFEINIPLKSLQSFMPTVCLVWFLVSISIILYHIAQHFQFMQTVNRWSEIICDEQLRVTFQGTLTETGITKHINMKFCDCIGSPKIVGYFKPVILLPKKDFAHEALILILRHELIHFKRKDIWAKSLLLFITAIHWFNPIIYLVAKIFCEQCELSCDEETIGNADDNLRQQYIKAIVSVIHDKPQIATILTSNFYERKNSLKKRIYSIMNPASKQTCSYVWLILLIICIVGNGIIVAFTA